MVTSRPQRNMFELLARGRAPPPLDGALADERATMHLAVFAGSASLLHVFDPPLATQIVKHRLEGVAQFTDLSTLVVSGRIHYPQWRTGGHYCGVHDVKIYRDDKEGDGRMPPLAQPVALCG